MFFVTRAMSEIQIRLCKTWEECLECEELQKRVWEMPDYRDVVPANLLITAIKNGGILVGAFDDDTLVGFAFGFLGSEGAGASRRLKHTSHMLAVMPGARTKGLGAQMKWAQRAEALRQGLDLMTWTYDPLQAINAHLNLNRLGAIARRYYRNAYGEMTDALNVGVASDRFEVEWYLTSTRSVEREGAVSSTESVINAQAVYELMWDGANLPGILVEAPMRGERILVEIPSDYNAVKQKNRALGIEWRERTRGTFERAFASGYAATRLVRHTDADGHDRTSYLLEKGP